MIDFVTIIFNNNKEIILQKIQVYSFYLVDQNIINNIYIIFNDNLNLFENFKKNFFLEIINYYPNYLHNKIILLNIEDIGLKFNNSSWFTQQIIKIQISNYVKSKYYVVLDCKNHFKEIINYDYFFDDSNKPKLNFNTHGDKMLRFYYNCLDYFNVDCPRKNDNNKTLKIQTITPFIFIKDVCLELISYIENKEKTTYYTFIDSTKKYTEFFLYYAFLIYTNKINLYNYYYNQSVITVGGMDPKVHIFNSWDYKKDYFKSDYIKVISLHRASLQYLDNTYKENLTNFYMNHYKTKKIDDLIKNFLY